MTNFEDIHHCPRCGAPVDGVGACFALLTEINAREYTNPDFGRAGHFSSTAHALQHPEDHQARDTAFHLVRLAWLLEFGGDPAIGTGTSWLDEKFDDLLDDLPDLQPPPSMQRGDITVVAISEAANAPEHVHLVREWGKAVWRAWSEHQPWARRWIMANQPEE